MSPRTGRPPKENPRNKQLNLRLTSGELSQIQKLADALQTSRTDAIIYAVNTMVSHFCVDYE